MRSMRFVVAMMLASALPAVADAAIVQTFTSRAAFTAATSGGSNLVYNPGSGYLAPTYAVGSLTFSAPDPSVSVFGDGTFISTDFDTSVLRLTFSTPVTALGLLGGVADENLSYVLGSLTLTINGATTVSFSNAAGSASYFGFISDVAINTVDLDIASFDVNATSAPYVTLEQQADIGQAGNAVPEPATWAMMLVGFGLVGGALRNARRPVMSRA